MKPFLRSQLERYAQRHGELDFLLSREDIMSDMSQFLKLSREHAEVTVIAGRYARLLQRESDLAAAREMLAEPDMADMAQEEIASAEAELTPTRRRVAAPASAARSRRQAQRLS
jgi:peptide chain release factor 1